MWHFFNSLKLTYFPSSTARNVLFIVHVKQQELIIANNFHCFKGTKDFYKLNSHFHLLCVSVIP